MAAYLEALLAVEYLRERWGMDGVQHVLQRLADGDSPDAALYSVTQMHYGDLEEGLTAYLQKRYASTSTAPQTE
ncbi:MAG TPA: hypothetical protein VLC12_05030, partial [Terriglobales bacterium]|nr:hypothetical protein [Terriglobales bacterium]